MLGAPVTTGAGLAALYRQGMAAWITAASVTPASPAQATLAPCLPGVPAAEELTVLLANLVFTINAEPAHA